MFELIVEAVLFGVAHDSEGAATGKAVGGEDLVRDIVVGEANRELGAVGGSRGFEQWQLGDGFRGYEDGCVLRIGAGDFLEEIFELKGSSAGDEGLTGEIRFLDIQAGGGLEEFDEADGGVGAGALHVEFAGIAAEGDSVFAGRVHHPGEFGGGGALDVVEFEKRLGGFALAAELFGAARQKRVVRISGGIPFTDRGWTIWKLAPLLVSQAGKWNQRACSNEWLMIRSIAALSILSDKCIRKTWLWK